MRATPAGWTRSMTRTPSLLTVAAIMTAACLTGSRLHAETAESISPCVVEILVTAQSYDSHMPWQKNVPASKAGYGVVISDGRLVTTEDLVRNAVLVEIRKPGSAIKAKALIKVADPRVNAALLEAPTPGLIPAEWSEPVKTGAKIQLAQFNAAGRQQVGEGRITSTQVGMLPNLAQNILTFQVLTDLKLERMGTPAFHEGRLVGLVMQYDEGSQTSMVLPSAILKRFVDDATHPPYRGAAAAGLIWAPLVEPAKRQYLGLTEDQKGVMVLRTVPGSCTSSILQPGDVILAWDGQTIDSQGYYDDPDFGRLSMVHLISGRRQPGEKVNVTVWRGRKQEEVQVTLDPYNDERALIPMNAEGRQAEYLIEGGLVVRELTADYLLAYGAQWMIRGNPRLVNLYLTRAQAPEKPGDRIVILTGVLPAPINVGYQSVRDEVITHVNGKPVSNLQDVFAIRAKDGGISQFTILSSGVDLVLDKTSLEDSNRRISMLYGIPKLAHRKPQPALGPLR